MLQVFLEVVFVIVVPVSFSGMPRWRNDERGTAWLRALPAQVDDQCDRWSLELDGDPMHGSNALVVPVRRSGEQLALRLAPPGDDVAAEVHALRTWDGRGTVRLVQAEEKHRAMLLERLDGTRTLGGEALSEAVEVLASLTRVLAVPVSTKVPSTSELARNLLLSFEAEWEALGGPTPRRVLEAALRSADVLTSSPAADTAVDGDLHFEQVLAARREPWLVVDPVLLRGDPEYDLGRILWSRLDEAEGDDSVLDLFDIFVDVAGVPAERATHWVVVRSMSYLLWGLRHGLTLDPPKCIRLLGVFS